MRDALLQTRFSRNACKVFVISYDCLSLQNTSNQRNFLHACCQHFLRLFWIKSSTSVAEVRCDFAKKSFRLLQQSINIHVYVQSIISAQYVVALTSV